MVSKKMLFDLKQIVEKSWNQFLRSLFEISLWKCYPRKKHEKLEWFYPYFLLQNPVIFFLKKAFSPKKQFGKVQDEFAESKKKDGKNAQFVHQGKNTFFIRHFVKTVFQKNVFLPPFLFFRKMIWINVHS